jgi:hypothetical protein
VTSLRMTAAQFRRLSKNIVPKTVGKSDLMTLHLWIVEAVHGKLTQDELRSAQFAQSRKSFVKLFDEWKKGQGTK